MISKILQYAGLALFGLTVWKGVHGFWVSCGLTLGAGLAYMAKHYDLTAEIRKLKSYLPPFHHAALFLLCLLTGSLASGCTVRKNLRANVPTVVIPRACLESVELTEKTECRADGETLHCGPILLKKKTGCETLSASFAEK